MYVIYYKTNEDAFMAYKDSEIGLFIGSGCTRKYIMSNVRQYRTFIGAERVANKLMEKHSNIVETKVVEFSKFKTYIDNLTCKCGCDITILPVGGGCYNIPNVGLIRPFCYDRIVPKRYHGGLIAPKYIDMFVHDRKQYHEKYAEYMAVWGR